MKLSLANPLLGLRTARFYSVAAPNPRYVELVRILKSDTPVPVGRLHAAVDIDLVVAHSASAECEIRESTDSQFAGLLFMDQAYLEALEFLLLLTLPKFNPISSTKARKFIERLLFHACIRSGNYRALMELEVVQSPSWIAPREFGTQEIALRLLIASHAVIAHEMMHFAHVLEQRPTAPSPRQRFYLEQSALSAIDRVEEKWRIQYPGVETTDASAQIRSELDYWLSTGWHEIACDLYGFREAYRSALQLDVPMASYVMCMMVAQGTTTLLNRLTAELMGAIDEVNPRNTARSILVESTLNDIMAERDMDRAEWDLILARRSRANRRLVDLIAGPALDRATALRQASEQKAMPSRKEIVSRVRDYGFAPWPDGVLHYMA